jgi:hypothetical protein
MIAGRRLERFFCRFCDERIPSLSSFLEKFPREEKTPSQHVVLAVIIISTLERSHTAGLSLHYTVPENAHAV